MATLIILQNSLFTTILLPFLLVFLLVFAILERTKIFGENRLNAFISFVIGLIVVAAFNYSSVINNLVLFLSIGLVILFVALLLWGFVSNGESGFDFKNHTGLRAVFFIVLILAVLLGVLWAFGIPLTGSGSVTNFLFNQVWSQPFWTNLIFIIIVGVLLAVILRMGSGSKK